MSLLERLQAAQQDGGEFALVLPAIGITDGRIESVEDDIVTVTMSDGAKVAVHFTCVGFLLGK